MKCRLVYINGVLDHILYDGVRDTLFDDFLKLTQDANKALELYANHESRRALKINEAKLVTESEAEVTRTETTDEEVAPITEKPDFTKKDRGTSIIYTSTVDGKYAGEVVIDRSSGTDTLESFHTKEQYEEQGLGSNNYKRVIDDYLNRNTRLSSEPNPEGDHKVIWDELVKEGKAEETEEGYTTLLAEGNEIVETLEDIQKTLTPIPDENHVEVRNLMRHLKTITAKELKEVLSQLAPNGVLEFSEETLTKVFRKSEAVTIIESEEIQNNLRDLYNSLDVTDIEDVEVFEGFIEGEGELGPYGVVESSIEEVAEQEFITAIAGSEDVLEDMPEEYREAYIEDAEFKAFTDETAETTGEVNVYRVENGELVDDTGITEEEVRNKVVPEPNAILQSIADNFRRANDATRTKSWGEVKMFFSISGLLDFENGGEAIYNRIAWSPDYRELFADLMDATVSYMNGEEASLQDITDLYNEFMRNESDVSTVTIKTPSPETTVVVKSPFSEIETMRRFNLVRVSGDVYRHITEETADEIIERAVEDVILNPERLSREEFEKRAYKEASKMRLKGGTKEEVLKNYLWKRYLDINTAKEPSYQTYKSAPITPVEQYIETSFIVDFNQYLINEKNRRFKITEKGVEVVGNIYDAINSLPQGVKEDFIQYATIAKHLDIPYIIREIEIEDSDSRDTARIEAYNNPLSINELTKPHVEVDRGVIAVKGIADQFTRIEDQIYEYVGEEGNLTFYREGKNANPNMIQFEIPAIEPLGNISEYTSYATEAFKMEIENKPLSQEVKDNYKC